MPMAISTQIHEVPAFHDTIVLDLPQPAPKSRTNPHLPPITIHPERLGGTATIAGTRLPVAALLDYLSEGYTIREFIEAFGGGITEGDCEAVLMMIKEAVEDGLIGEKVNE
ncbi:MAG: DUF433 domain-containing protein [Blastocatellia bacterium]